MSNPAKTWDFTLNNYTEKDIELFKTWCDDVNRMVVSKEVGEKGTRHLQGRITFKRAYRLTGLKKLHSKANWSITNCDQDSLYCMKEDGDLIININNRKQGNRTDLDELTESIKEKKTKEQLWKDHPKAMIKYHKGAYEMMTVMNKPETKIRFKLKEFKPWIPITEWDKSIILIGDSGIGKTEFAKAHFKKPLMVSHIDDLRLLDTHDGIIFDDMDFKHWPRTSQIHITDIDENRSINVKYGTALIPAESKKIFTCNELPVDIEDPAIRRRCRVVRLPARSGTK